MTVHKAQGRTIPKVALALAHRQMTYASIYVALSRVKLSDDIRILYHNSGPRPGVLGLQYNTQFKHCVHVLDYYSGFPKTDQGGIWNPALSLANKDLRLKIIYCNYLLLILVTACTSTSLAFFPRTYVLFPLRVIWTIQQNCWIFIF